MGWSLARRHTLPAASLRDLAGIRRFVVSTMHEAEMTEEADAMALVVDEVCANLITHGYGADGAGPIDIELWTDMFGATVQIDDVAPHFDPDDAPPPDLTSDWAQRRVGGLGWHFVRQLTDDCKYERRDRGNRLTLHKDRAAFVREHDEAFKDRDPDAPTNLEPES